QAFILSVERHVLRNYIYLHAIEKDLPLPMGTQDAGPALSLRSDQGQGWPTVAGRGVVYHTRIVPSSPPLPTLFPTGLKHTLRTKLQCPWRERVSWPVCASHTFTVLS